MSNVNTISCDECGKLRVNDSNHWLEGVTSDRIILIALVGQLPEQPHEDPRHRKHFCGQEHAMKWVALQMGNL
jgi:hypothetical protein